MKASHKPRYNDITPNNVIYSQHKAKHEYKYNIRGNNKWHNSKPEENKNNQALECYYCNGPHYITNCTKFKADKDKYKLKTHQVRKKYLERIRQRIQKKNVSSNKTALDNDPKIDQGYTKEEAEQLCDFLVDTDSEWLWQSVQEVQTSEVSATTPILYNLINNNMLVKGLFDTDAFMSVMSEKFL